MTRPTLEAEVIEMFKAGMNTSDIAKALSERRRRRLTESYIEGVLMRRLDKDYREKINCRRLSQ